MTDGYKLSPEAERKLNEAFAVVFTGEAGQDVLSYLQNITINSIHGPDVTPDQLMHKEGARWLVAIINMRTEEGINGPGQRRNAGGKQRGASASGAVKRGRARRG